MKLVKNLAEKSFLKIALFAMFMCNAILASAQNAADSDLSNVADSNKNWREGWWLIAIVLLLVFVVYFVYRKRKSRV